MKTELIIVCVLFSTASWIHADSVLSPSLDRDPNIAGPSPFLLTTDIGSSLRIQQVYRSTDFTSLGTTPLLITEISLGAVPGAVPFPLDVMLPSIQINMSTTLRNPDGLSTTFAGNIGADDTVVLSGPLHFYDTGVGMYGIHIQLQHPFVYDPQAGNLLMDVRNFSAIAPPPPGRRYSIWGEATLGDSVSLVGADNVLAASGISLTSGYVTRFTVVAVPEPSAVALFALGVVGLAVRGWKCRRAATEPSR